MTGREALAEEFNKGAKKQEVVSGRTLWRWLKNFETWQMLSIKSSTKFSVITVNNWSSYQSLDQQVSSTCPTDVQHVSTNKNDKNEKNNISRKSAKRFYEDDSDEMILVEPCHVTVTQSHATDKDIDKDIYYVRN